MERVAVLSSGGLDSSALLSDLARDSAVFPVYVEAGLAWEQVERKALQSYIEAFKSRNVAPVTVLSAPARPLYGDQHWSVTGTSVPDAQAPDAAMFMPGRNIMLIGMAAVWCSIHDVSRIAIGSLGGNPFPDATPEFFESFGKALSSRARMSATLGESVASLRTHRPSPCLPRSSEKCSLAKRVNSAQLDAPSPSPPRRATCWLRSGS